MPTRRYQDRKCVYSLDFPGHTTVVRQRVYKTADGSIQTPLPPLWEVRELPGNAPAPRARRFEPRRAIACFQNPENATGLSELAVALPYAPFDSDFRPLMRQIRQSPNVASARYEGESHTLSVEPYL